MHNNRKHKMNMMNVHDCSNSMLGLITESKPNCNESDIIRPTNRNVKMESVFESWDSNRGYWTLVSDAGWNCTISSRDVLLRYQLFSYTHYRMQHQQVVCDVEGCVRVRRSVTELHWMGTSRSPTCRHLME